MGGLGKGWIASIGGEQGFGGDSSEAELYEMAVRTLLGDANKMLFRRT